VNEASSSSPPAGDRGELPGTIASRGEPIAAERAPFVVVLGMHRSGTSLCSHILGRLGIAMADQPEAQPSNPKGQWERPEIVDRHDRILALFGRGYLTPLHDLPLPSGWWLDPAVGEIRREIVSFLEQKLVAGAPFGFKDPRTARLLPLWHQIFDELRLDPKIILCVRSPAQVARSLEERDGLPSDLGEHRWFVYTAEILRHLRNFATCVIEYEAWFDDAADNLDKLSRFLGLPAQPEFATAIAELTAALGAGPGAVPASHFSWGPYYTFVASGSENIANTISDSKVRLNPLVKDSIQAGDTRASKIVNTTVLSGFGLSSSITYSGSLATTANQNAPLGILRDEELVLVRAQAEIEAGQLANAILDVNEVRTNYGLAPTTFATVSDGRNAVLYEKRYSLLFEGPMRADDLREYKLLSAAFHRPETLTDPFNAALPIPRGELNARSLTVNPACTP